MKKKKKETIEEKIKRIQETPEIEKSDYAENIHLKHLENWLKSYFFVITTVVSIIINLIFLTSQNIHILRLKDVFFNQTGNFQWAGIVALITIVSVISTAIIAVKRNRADLVSKSRIEWLQVNKKIMSEYLKDVHYYPYLFSKWKKALEDGNPIKEELDELSQKIEQNQYLLLLNLGDNEDNTQINDCIIGCTLWTNSIQFAWDMNKQEINTKDTPVTNLLKVSRDYFNREWNKAKKGR